MWRSYREQREDEAKRRLQQKEDKAERRRQQKEDKTQGRLQQKEDKTQGRLRRAQDKIDAKAALKEIQYPTLSTAAEYQAEARLDPPLIRFFGAKAGSAIRNRQLLTRRYRRHKEWFGIDAIPWRLPLLYLIGVALAVGPAWAGWLLVDSRAHMPAAPHPITGAISGGTMGMALAGLVIVFIWWMYQWNKLSGPAVVWERADKDRPWHTTGVLLTRVCRLAFLVQPAKQASVWSGPTRLAGPQHGIVNLELQVGKRLEELEGVTDLYDLPAAVSTWSEVPAREAYSLFIQAIRAGHKLRRARLARNKGLTEIWPVVVFIIELLIVFLQAGSFL